MSLSAATYKRDVRTLLLDFIEVYFDGGPHVFGGVPVTFPAASGSCDRPQFGEPLSAPLIVMLPAGGEFSRERAATGTGARTIKEVPYRFIVYTTDPYKVWDTNDNVQDKLGVALNGAQDELKDLRVLKVGEAHLVATDPSHEWQVSERIVTFLPKVEFGAGA